MDAGEVLIGSGVAIMGFVARAIYKDYTKVKDLLSQHVKECTEEKTRVLEQLKSVANTFSKFTDAYAEDQERARVRGEKILETVSGLESSVDILKMKVLKG